VSQRTGLAFAWYEARRVAQTRSTFANWPALLREMAGQRIGRGGAELQFVTRDGMRLACPNVPGARLPMYEQFADDCYDLGWVLGAPDSGPMCLLDIGAHVGAFAVNVARSRPGVHVECYEPSPQTASFLQQNVDANGFGDRIRVHRSAMAAAEGTALLDDNSGGSVHNGLVKSDHRLVDGDDSLGRRGTISVPATTFDRAVAEAPAPVRVVKMDCEGGEYELVYASLPASWASVQRVVMEYHPVAGESWERLSTWFSAVGLQVVRHVSDSPGLGTAWLERRAPDTPAQQG
jgi:FkbM family methyltransferase